LRREKAALPPAMEVENTSLTSIIPEGDDEDDSDDSAFGDEEEVEEVHQLCSMHLFYLYIMHDLMAAGS